MQCLKCKYQQAQRSSEEASIALSSGWKSLSPEGTSSPVWHRLSASSSPALFLSPGELIFSYVLAETPLAAAATMPQPAGHKQGLLWQSEANGGRRVAKVLGATLEVFVVILAMRFLWISSGYISLSFQVRKLSQECYELHYSFC